MFNYETCTMTDMIAHINSITRQSINQASDRYELRGQWDVVEKIRVGKILAKIEKLKEEI